MDVKKELGGYFTVVAGICVLPGLLLTLLPMPDFERGFVWGILFTAIFVVTLWWWVTAFTKRDGKEPDQVARYS